LDNRKSINDIFKADSKVKSFLSGEFSAILKDERLQEAVLAHLEPAAQTERYEKLIGKLQKIIDILE
jgi:hypothetical protein